MLFSWGSARPRHRPDQEKHAVADHFPNIDELLGRIQADYHTDRETVLTDAEAAMLRAWLEQNPKPPAPWESRGPFYFYGLDDALWVHYRYVLSRFDSAGTRTESADPELSAEEQAVVLFTRDPNQSDRSIAKQIGCSPSVLSRSERYQALKQAHAGNLPKGKKSKAGDLEAWDR
jgi:hypothetical protein